MSMVDIFEDELFAMTETELTAELKWQEYYLNDPNCRYADAYKENIRKIKAELEKRKKVNK